ncbi:MAG: MFS transporter [Spirochaetales bacterium]|nr:MFS transporter [Spirochaetales bacterium]
MMRSMLRKLNREERSWVAYDWASSAYSIVVTTAIFPIFYQSITPERIYLSTWGYANSLASLFVALLAPILGTIADYWGRKRRFFLLFFTLGVVTTMSFVLTGEGQWFLALVLYVGSLIGFSGANLFYDSFLVDVTTEERMDRVSTQGFGFGYIGSTIPFVAGILLITAAERIGISTMAATRLAFLITGLWWLVFGIPIIRNVRQKYGIEPHPHPIRDSFARLKSTLSHIRNYRSVFIFLVAYFFYIDGVDTIIRMATPIALSMGIDSDTLLIILLVIQIVAFPCAILYGRLAVRFSAWKMLFVGIGVYVGVVLVAFFLPSIDDLGRRTALFWVLSLMVASSQGGIQALSRSIYGKLIPKERSAEFFGFYNIFGRFAAIMGPFLVAGVTQITGQERFGVLSILIVFIVGGVMLAVGGDPDASVERRDV